MKLNENHVCLILITLWLFLVVQIPAEAGIMGIDEPGSTQWPNHWVGCVSDVLPLDYDASPSSVSIDSVRGNAYVTFSMHLAPYIRKVSIPDLSISEAIRWNHSLGSIVTSVQMENLDQTMFLSNRSDHSYLIRMSNLNDQIENISKIDYLVVGPLVYSETLRCVFFRNSANNQLIHKYSLDSGEVNDLILSAVDTSVADLIFDDTAGNLYALSSDYPGDVIRVDGDSFQVTNSITLPGYLRCEQGVLDHLNNQLLIKAGDQVLSPKFLGQIELLSFVTGNFIMLEESEANVSIIGTCDSYFMIVASNTGSSLTRFMSSDLTRVETVSCSENFQSTGVAIIDNNSILVIDSSSPSLLELYSCDPVIRVSSNVFSGNDSVPFSLALNKVQNDLIISLTGSDPGSVSDS